MQFDALHAQYSGLNSQLLFSSSWPGKQAGQPIMKWNAIFCRDFAAWQQWSEGRFQFAVIWIVSLMKSPELLANIADTMVITFRMCVFLYVLNAFLLLLNNNSPHAGMVLLTLVIHLWCSESRWTSERRGQQYPEVHFHRTQAKSELCQNKPFCTSPPLSCCLTQYKEQGRRIMCNPLNNTRPTHQL